MLSSGFTNAPVTKYLVTYIVVASIVATLTDTKHFFYIQVVPHLWWYRQIWRLFTWQACFTNSTEVLFGALTLYHMRVIERLWGSRKFASFLIATMPLNALLPPLLLALVIRPVTFNQINYFPAGPTPIIFALLAQYHAAIPQIYKYRIATSTSTASSNTPAHGANGITLSDKTLTYILPLQLAMSQLPMSAVSALVGWIVGYAYRYDLLLPPSASRWRIPAWMFKDKGQPSEQGFEALRRRLAGDTGSSRGGSGSAGPSAR